MSYNLNLNLEELRLLAIAEHQMDTGAVPFVIYAGNRVMTDKGTLELLGLVNGQTVNDVLFGAILRNNLERVQQEIAYRNSKSLIADVLSEDSD